MLQRLRAGLPVHVGRSALGLFGAPLAEDVSDDVVVSLLRRGDESLVAQPGVETIGGSGDLIMVATPTRVP